jgi:hypothetical protein
MLEGGLVDECSAYEAQQEAVSACPASRARPALASTKAATSEKVLFMRLISTRRSRSLSHDVRKKTPRGPSVALEELKRLIRYVSEGVI